MKVKIGDNVKILAGKDRGKEGKVLTAPAVKTGERGRQAEEIWLP